MPTECLRYGRRTEVESRKKESRNKEYTIEMDDSSQENWKLKANGQTQKSIFKKKKKIGDVTLLLNPSEK